MSPRCWLSHAESPAATAKVFLRSPPTARIGGARRRAGRRAAARSRATRRIGSGSPSTTPHDGVVAGHLDRPVVRAERVGESGQPFAGLVVVDSRSARRRGCPWSPQRCGGSTSEPGTGGRGGGAAACTAASRRSAGSRGDIGATGATGRRADQHDRAGDGQHVGLDGIDLGDRSATARSATITANGLSARRLRGRRRATAVVGASQARWYPPRPLTATIPPAQRPLQRGEDRVGAGDGAALAGRRGAAHRAGDGLGVEAPVGGIVVLGRAGGAHRRTAPSWCSVGRRADRG